MGPTGSKSSRREILIGCNSKLWRALSGDEQIRAAIDCAIGHRDIKNFAFAPDDRVWVLSYSRRPKENAALLDSLKDAGVSDVVYFSSATTNVMAVTRCYEYPRVKSLAADYARRAVRATIVLLGLVYVRDDELPAGCCAAVSIDAVRAFILDPPVTSARADIRLFEMVETPFGSRLERVIYSLYNAAQRLAGNVPCVLRPMDLILRRAGWRWYGYLNLSNRLWSSTTL